jgi:hypothetical protein
MVCDGCASKFQRALTIVVEAWREKQLAAEVLALQVHDRIRLCCRAIRGSRSSVAWVTVWPSPAVSMALDNLHAMAAWFVGEGPHLLRPPLGLALRSKGAEGVCVDEHGVADRWQCASLGEQPFGGRKRRCSSVG